MKLQDVLLKAMAKKITWWDAAEIIGVSDRTMRRWRERIDEGGYSGLADRRKGKPSGRRVALAVCVVHPRQASACQRQVEMSYSLPSRNVRF